MIPTFRAGSLESHAAAVVVFRSSHVSEDRVAVSRQNTLATSGTLKLRFCRQRLSNRNCLWADQDTRAGGLSTELRIAAAWFKLSTAVVTRTRAAARALKSRH